MDKKVIHSVFEEVVRRQPFRLAIESDDKNITYDELNRFSNRLSHLLRSVGSGKDRIVNVIIPSSIELVGAMLAVFKSGAVYLPVDLSFSRKRLTQIFKETFNGIVIVAADAYDDFIVLARELDIKNYYAIVTDNNNGLFLYRDIEGFPVIGSIEETPGWEDNLPLEVDGDSSNYIFYTSGSTGEGKAILGAHASLSHFIHWEIREFGIGESFRISQLTQVTFDASLRDIYVALISGGTLCIPSPDCRNNPAKLLKWLESSGISLVHCVPSLFRVLIKELQSGRKGSYDLSSLAYILMAGEMLYARDIIEWRKWAGDGIRLVNLYGATETTLVKTFYRIDMVPDNPVHIIPAGLPISNTIVAIVKDGTICNSGEIGEIYIKTPFASKGYYRNEKLTGECFVQNPLLQDVKDIVYKTGDLGRYLPDGNIEVMGRLDSQVKVNGIRVELVEVEQAILKQENITGVAVKAHRKEDDLLTLIAYYTGKKMDAGRLRDSLGTELNQPVIPSYFIHLDEFPLTINGKIDKKALPLPADIIMGDTNFEAPAGDCENRLAVLWKDILGIEKIGRNISFFNVGGHSLRAIQLVSRIHKEFGADLKIAEIFTHRTIREQADLLSTASGKKYTPIDPVPVQPHYDLSSSQRRMWILSQFGEGNAAYNIQGVYVLEGELDPGALEYAFSALIERHEVLRTIFIEDGQGRIRQFIQSPGEIKFRLAYRDLRRLSQPDEQVKKILAQEFAQPFDLSSGALFRTGLFQLADNKWIFSYTLHHIISDGWSIGVIMKELRSLYNARVGGEGDPLDPLLIQYKDYAAWQQAQLQGETLDDHKAWWLEQFGGDIPALELPGDRSRPAVRSNRGGMITLHIDTVLSGGFQSLCEEQGATLFMGLLAVVNVLLYRYTNQEDIIVGSPIAGREHADLEGQIGFYVNTLALRTRLEGHDNFRQLLQRVKESTLGAYEHQLYPFDRLVDELHLRRDMSRNPLFDVMLVLQNDDHNDVIKNGQYLSGVKIYAYKGEEIPFSKFDLQFNFTELAGKLQAGIEYNSDICNRDTVERMGIHLEQLMAAVIGQPSASVQQLDLLHTAEKDRLLTEFNPAYVPVPGDKTVLDLLKEQMEGTPDAVALVFGGTALTYRELDEKSNRLANYLRNNYDIRADDLIGIILDRSENMIIAIIGILRSGAAYVPIDPAYPAARKELIIRDIRAKALITQADYFFDLEFYTGALFAMDVQLEAIDASVVSPGAVIAPGDLAYVIYTSGSTGQPKGCAVTHGNLFHYIHWANGYYPGESGVLHFGLFTSLSFDLTITSIFSALTQGGRLRIYAQREELGAILRDSFRAESGINSIKLTPSHINMLEHLGIVSDTLSVAIVGGEQVTSRQVRILKDINPSIRIYNEYGPTEATVGCVVARLELDAPVRIGKPVSHAGIYILDAGALLSPIGVPGEICISGAGVARGYLNNPGLTAEKFVANPYREGERMYKTGDLGRWLPDGNIEFIGRKDDQVKIRGYRIEVGEIEMVLQAHEAVEAAVVIARTGKEGEKELVAYLVSREELQTADLRVWLSKYLPAYLLPSHYVQLEFLPLTHNGKVNRKELPDPEGLGISTGVSYVAPGNEMGYQLIAVFEEVLKKQPISIKDDFFVLGGDSIKSIQIVSRLRQKGYSLTIHDILSWPVIEDIIRRVKIVGRVSDQEPVEGMVPLSPIQASFFRNSSPDKHHYNQSILLQSRETISETGLRAALDKIVLHHDALRMVYRSTAEGWVQENKGREQGYSLEIIERAAEIMQESGEMAQEESEASFRAHCDRIQSGIDLERGPLFKTGLFRDPGGDRLLLVAHHLVMDGVSWRILLEDLSHLYQQYLSGEQLSLPLKTDSFKYWQEQQMSYAASETLQKEEPYWSAIESLSINPLPMDIPSGSNLIKDASSCSFLLDEQMTERLLTRCYKAYSTEINDILLSALSLAIAETFGLDKILLSLEGHGREPIGADADVSRTIGWFTTIYPVVFDMRYRGDAIRQLIEVKESLHRVPNKGIGYGNLRYLAGKGYALDPEITFNYLGDFGSAPETGQGDKLFEFSGDYHGFEISGNRHRGAILNVSGMITGGRMRLSITYSHRQYEESTIIALQAAYRQKLEEMIRRLSAEETTHLSPVDLTYKDLSVEELQKLNKLLC